MLVRTCGKNARRKNSEKKCWRISHKGKCPFESQVRDGWKVLKMI